MTELLETKSEQPSDRVELVGIGASAGGLQAVQALLEALPERPGMAFALVMHLHPEHKSELAAILARSTRMEVEQVTGPVPIALDHVYVVPPNRRLVVADHTLDIREFEDSRGHRSPIDLFFRSLAESEVCNLAVLLSGGGSDGVVGLRAIKAQGGVVLVQDPAEAEFDTMPRSALEAGLVDFSLPVRELAGRLIELRDARGNLPDDVDELDGSESKALERVLIELRNRIGHDFTRYKPSTVLRRVGRRMQIRGVDDLSAYRQLLRRDETESRDLFADLLISVTSFFRDPEAFEMLEQRVVPQLFEGKQSGDPVRVWVPGCATGEEAYSIGMLLLDHAAGLEHPSPAIQIFASDLDERALELAREGRYPAPIAADVPEERLERYFSNHHDHYVVNKNLREIVLFARHDLMSDPPFARLDLVSCRNLLIYMQGDLQEQVFDVFRYALLPGGFLFLGASEGPGTDAGDFQQVSKRQRIYRLRGGKGADGRHVPPNRSGFVHHATPRRARPRPAEPPEAVESMHRRLLEELAPPSLVVDEEHRILHLSEHAGRYLLAPGGELTNDVLRLIRPELRAPLESALHRAFGDGRRGSMPEVPVAFDGESAMVQVLAHRAPADAGRDQAVLVLLLEHEPFESAAEDAGTTPTDGVQQLEAELLRTRRELREVRERHAASNEELRAANEELQSINEEYRSTTEELETSKEELQSLNEELQTVNAELRMSYDQLAKTHGDLINLTAATDIATLFLDSELHIRRFTPRLADLFNIRHADVGRPIRDLTHNLEYPNLFEDARRAIEGTARTVEVRGRGGAWYSARLAPYYAPNGAVDGAMISFLDVTALKLSEAELLASKADLEKRVKAATRRIRQLASQVTMAELAERNRIAQILHDQIQQILHAIQIKVGLIGDREEHSEDVAGMLVEIDEWLERALRITRELAVDLSPPVLDKEGLGAAVRWLAGQMASLHGLKVSIEDDQSKGLVFPRDHRTLLFQVVRELLFNVVKHAATDSATVRLSNDDSSFQIEVADQGKGFDPQVDTAASDGFGLDNLRHRLSLIDGELDLQSAPGSGTVATIRMPDCREPAS